MKKKILLMLATILATLFLVFLPFLIGTAISQFTPYVETNSFQNYVIICTIISIAFVAIAFLVFKYLSRSYGKISAVGTLLFLLACPIIGIFGLAAAPDLSLKMLEHPEREHLRYFFLFIAAILFGSFILFLFIYSSLQMNYTTRWVIASLFAIAFAEFIWEFNHHYSYPEALKEWISQGKRVEEFVKSYDNFNIVIIGVLGRYSQFVSLIWLSLYFYKLKQIKIWSPILIILLSSLGIISATVILITNMTLPKGFEFLFLFFIPGIPFILLYWLGVALVTKVRKSELAA